MIDEATPYTLPQGQRIEREGYALERGKVFATVEALDAAEAERDALRKSLASADAALLVELKRAEKAEATLVARHGGEPLALLAELDAARAEVERLREALKATDALVTAQDAMLKQSAEREDALTAEVKRLTEALGQIAQGKQAIDYAAGIPNVDKLAAGRLAGLARAALKETKR